MFSIFFNFTLAFVLIIEIIKTVQTFSIDFGQSTQNQLTKSDTDPTPMLCRHGCGTKSEESKQLRFDPYSMKRYYIGECESIELTQ